MQGNKQICTTGLSNFSCLASKFGCLYENTVVKNIALVIEPISLIAFAPHDHRILTLDLEPLLVPDTDLDFLLRRLLNREDFRCAAGRVLAVAGLESVERDFLPIWSPSDFPVFDTDLAKSRVS